MEYVSEGEGLTLLEELKRIKNPPRPTGDKMQKKYVIFSLKDAVRFGCTEANFSLYYPDGITNSYDFDVIDFLKKEGLTVVPNSVLPGTIDVSGW